jgi:hypothetical protein
VTTRRIFPAQVTCVGCHQTLGRSAFSRGQVRKPIGQWRCRPCGSEARRAWGDQPFGHRAFEARPSEPRGPLSPRDIRRAQIVAWVEKRKRQGKPADLESIIRWARRAHYNPGRPEGA